MQDLKSLQQAFMAHLLGQPSAIEAAVESTRMMSAHERLHIYANAYRMRLKEALQTDFEKLHGYLGDVQFDALMNHYIDLYPSHTTSLRYFSENLPAMLGDNPPYNEFSEVVELAMIEQAFGNSFDADNADYLKLEDFAAVPEQVWPGLQFSFQPSLQILPCRTNAFAIWKALAAEKSPPEKQLKGETEHWVIWRRSDLISHYRPLQAAEKAALTAALSGDNFAVICETLLAFFSEQDTPMRAIGFLQSWVQEEMLAGLDYADN
jgi:hypothetical protein